MRLGVLWRRKWIFLLAAIVVPAAAVLYSLHQPAKYEASADVLLGRQDTISALTGTPDLQSVQDPQRNVDTQVVIAREPEVAARVLDVTNLHDRTSQQFLDASSVSSQSDTDVLTLRVTDRNPKLAVALATAYAQQFASYSGQLDTNAITKALYGVRHQMAGIPRSDHSSQYYTNLVNRATQLQTALALLTSNASVVRVADGATQVQPKPVRNGLLGLVLGLVLGIALVFFRDALDTSVRTAEEIRTGLHLPLLARIPRPPRRIRSSDQLVMVADPASPYAEPYRVLRTNLEFVSLERKPKTILITSAVEEEGKSTTAANLAVALARAGRNVVLVDLDLRRPSAHRLFRCDNRPGLTEVALGHVRLDQALVSVDPVSGLPAQTNGRPTSRVQVKTASATSDHAANGQDAEDMLAAELPSSNGRQFHGGALRILPSGPLPPDPGEFVGSIAVKTMLDSLKDSADVVVVDSPPVLHVGDALTLSAIVDGIIVVARVELLSRRTLAELRRVLDGCFAERLGVVIAGAEVDGDYSYTYGGYPERSDQRLEVLR